MLIELTPERVEALKIALDAISDRDEECEYGNNNGFPEMDAEREVLETAAHEIETMLAEAGEIVGA
jgi:hypothetical protein